MSSITYWPEGCITIKENWPASFSMKAAVLATVLYSEVVR